MPPPARRVSSPPLAGPPSYGLGSSGYGGAPNANAAIAASGMRLGGPPTSSNGPPAISRNFSPPPPLSSQSVFAKVMK